MEVDNVDTHPNVFDCWTYSKEHRLKRDIDTYVISISGCFIYVHCVYALEIHYDINGSQQKLRIVEQFQSYFCRFVAKANGTCRFAQVVCVPGFCLALSSGMTDII